MQNLHRRQKTILKPPRPTAAWRQTVFQTASRTHFADKTAALTIAPFFRRPPAP
ncbi:hypothetical protein [Neisseria elongata]|uniref:Uncharacterized protein n=1 Tax=Neisseria elongata subsp. nitroreducens TaxID=90367 RepID=A0A9X0ZX50_NEIEL|nr:hypothetical protein [Neisseria elongata]MBS9340627.1 hypothetical protein [Neisseria elongata subsp. nitroreducens]